MNNRKFILALSIGLSIWLNSCTQDWTKAIKRGKIEKEQFIETVDTEVKIGLIIVPVTIKGNSYRFLFDTGAPFSISNKLQENYKYKIISKGHIVDSDKNRSKVNYVEVDEIEIGSIPFLEQVAFVGDFESNPIIKCLNIDGIIGSNLMRHCNWKIDYQHSKLTLSSLNQHVKTESSIAVPFQHDKQYDLLVDLTIGTSVVENLKVDFGSNGFISIPKATFNHVKQHEKFLQIFQEVGYAQSGIVGERINIDRQLAYLDKVNIDGLFVNDVEIKQGSSGLIGSQLLSRYVVTIDWLNKKLYFEEVINKDNTLSRYGIKVGCSNENKVYIQSVIVDSDAFNFGIKPGMNVLKIDSLDFENEHTICNYLNYTEYSPKKIQIELLNAAGKREKVILEKRSISKR